MRKGDIGEKGSEGDERPFGKRETNEKGMGGRGGRGGKEVKREQVNEACKNIISPDRAAAVTAAANNEPDFISRAD